MNITSGFRNCEKQHIEQGIADFGRLARILQLTKVLRKGIKAHYGAPKREYQIITRLEGKTERYGLKNSRDPTLRIRGYKHAYFKHRIRMESGDKNIKYQ